MEPEASLLVLWRFPEAETQEPASSRPPHSAGRVARVL